MKFRAIALNFLITFSYTISDTENRLARAIRIESSRGSHIMSGMATIDDKLVTYSRTIVSGVIFECPFCTPSEDCPIRPLRNLDPEERLDKVMQMSRTEIVDLAEHHFACAQRRILQQKKAHSAEAASD